MWKNGVQNGLGILKNKDYYYVGDFVEGVKAGFGNLRWINEEFYSGEFVNDKRHGRGEMILADGSSYKGDWIDDNQSG